MTEVFPAEETQRDAFVRVAPDIARALYRGILGREADAKGLEICTRKLREGENLEETLVWLMNCAEFRLKSMAALSPEMVTAAYKGILGRTPDPEGFKLHTSRLMNRPDIAAFLKAITESLEFQQAFRKRYPEKRPASRQVQVSPGKVPSIVSTHHKCASRWLAQILGRYCTVFRKSLFKSHFSGVTLPEGQDFDVLLLTNSDYETCVECYQPWLDSGSHKAVHVIRNPLDIVVSAYYSHLSSHSIEGWPELAHQRENLRTVDKTSGMLATWVFLERSDFHYGAVGPLFALRRWKFNDPRIKTLRMEDLVADPELARSELRSLLGEDPAELISQVAFEKLSGGRPRGVIDNQNHYRSGVPHQWVHEMDASLAQVIYLQYKDMIDAYYPEVEPMLRR